MPFLQSEADWHTTHASLLSPPELTILIPAALLTSLLVQFYPKTHEILGPLYQLSCFSPSWLCPAPGGGKPQIPVTNSAISIPMLWAEHH